MVAVAHPVLGGAFLFPLAPVNSGVLRWVALRLQDRRGATVLRPPSLAGWRQGGVFSAGGLPLYSCSHGARLLVLLLGALVCSSWVLLCVRIFPMWLDWL